MPLRLTSLELHGYKTFASRTVFEFADGITAIVGPNGSGKSNFADSLRWVLGEQSYHLLRAKKTEDMIFSGSEKRARAGMASVTITFDNTTGWLPIDFSEVAVTRRAHRDGHNEYLLNGQSVRLKDINELLARSGLSERTYTILGQGMVDASLALKADDRRKLFEEAAGIGLYRSRREEALRRLETTQRNLERVLDILAELEPRLRGLERQARRAEEYRILQDELRLILREWYGYHWHTFQRNFIEAQKALKIHDNLLVSARDSFSEMTSQFKKAREDLLTAREQVNGWTRQLNELNLERESIRKDIAVLEERQKALVDTKQRSELEIQRLKDELRIAGEREADARVEFETIEAEVEEAKKQESEAKIALDGLNLERALLQQKIDTSRTNLNELNNRRANHLAHLNELKNRIANYRERLKNSDVVIANAEETRISALSAFEEANTKQQGAEAELKEIEDELTALRDQISELENRKHELLEQKNSLISEQTKLLANLEMIEQAESSLTGFTGGAKFLLEAVKQNRLSGSKGLLSAALDVPKEFEVAVAAVLGELFDSVVLDSDKAIEQALHLMDEASDRAVFFSVDPKISGEKQNVGKLEGAVGKLPELIKVDKALQPFMNSLFGDTVIVENRALAKQLRVKNPGFTYVTLQGEVFRPNGFIFAGKVNKASTLGRPREKRELLERLNVISAEAENVNQNLSDLNQVVARLRIEISKKEIDIRNLQVSLKGIRQEENKRSLAYEASLRQVEFYKKEQQTLSQDIKTADKDKTEIGLLLEEVEERISVEHESLRELNGLMAELSIDETNSDLNLWQARVSVSNRSLNDAKQRLSERNTILNSIARQLEAGERQFTDFEKLNTDLEIQTEEARRSEITIVEKLDHLKVLLEPGEEVLGNAEKRENELQGQELDSQRNLTTVERIHSQLQLEVSRKEEALENLKRRIEEDFGLVQFDYEQSITGAVPLPMGDLVETLPLVIELPSDLEDALNAKRGQIKRMGSINPDAQQEYRSVKERFHFMNEQVDDLNKAELDLREVIRELDEVTRKEFSKTFEEVAEEFKKIFTRLFGGGSARLILTDPDNLTETGIDIEAKLPGRREQGLSLLSGGERSLTAISLVFALLKVSPTPVCVMDEVDAMLDEANVGRFRDLLDELSRSTQFIIVTHNRNTVQVADVLYGITMGKDSASQQISLKLDELSEEMLGSNQ